MRNPVVWPGGNNSYQQLLDNVYEGWGKYEPMDAERNQLAEEQSTRIQAVQDEFAPRFKAANALIEHNEAARSPEAIREQVAEAYEHDTPIGQAVVDIAVHQSWSGSTNKFIHDIARYPIMGLEHERMVNFMERYAALTRLDKQLTNLPADTNESVLLLNLTKRTKTEQQALTEGCDSYSGQPITRLSAIYGQIGPTSLEVRKSFVYRDDTIAPVIHAECIVLKIDDALAQNEGRSHLLEIHAGEHIARIGLFGAKSRSWRLDNSSKGPKIDFAKFDEGYFAFENRHIAEPHRFVYLQVGREAILHAIDSLVHIPDLERESRKFAEDVAVTL